MLHFSSFLLPTQLLGWLWDHWMGKKESRPKKEEEEEEVGVGRKDEWLGVACNTWQSSLRERNQEHYPQVPHDLEASLPCCEGCFCNMNNCLPMVLILSISLIIGYPFTYVAVKILFTSFILYCSFKCSRPAIVLIPKESINSY